MKNLEFVIDYFGNQIKVGDNVIFAKANHTSLTIGEVIKIGNSGTYIIVKVVFAGFEGYCRDAKSMIGEEMKVMLNKTVKETNSRREEENGEYKWYRDEYETDYVYCLKWDRQIPEIPQYRYIKTEPR